MNNYERKTQETFGKLLERAAELDMAIEGLQIALSENETYKSLVKMQEERASLFDNFKAEKLKEFQKRKIKTIEGEYGKVTLQERNTYKVVDSTAVPEEFKTKLVDMDLVKEQYLLGKTVPGIEKKTTCNILLTPAKKEGQSS